MIKKSWSFELEDGRHTVQLEQGYFSATRKVRLDDRLLDKEVKVKRNWLGEGEYEFNVNSHTGNVVVRNNVLTYTYDLAIDGNSVTTGKSLTALPPIPGWTWLFVIACGVIPLIALGGALPIVLGFGGAAGCIVTARDTSKTMGVRVAICVGITVLVWILFAALVIGVAILNS